MAFYKNPIIQSIEFSGLVNSSPKELENIIYVKQGKPINEEALNKSIKILFGLDRFSDVKVDVKENKKGLDLTFIVQENIYIRKVDYQGNRAQSKENLEEVSLVSDDSYYNPGKIQRTKILMQKLYEDDGYIEVSFKSRLVPVNEQKNTYDLIFEIDEGKKVVVESIVITGNEQINVGEIKGVMQTKEKAFIFRPGVLKENEFKEDKARILAYYGQKGYIDAKINRYEWKIENMEKDNHKAIVVYVDISEGSQYFMGTVMITNNALFSYDELSKEVKLKEGDIYNQTKMDMARFNIYNKYSDNGHLYANVSVLQDKDTVNHVVNSRIVIYEGPRSHIESISFEGNEKTKTYVMKRELLFTEGELYIQRKVRQSYERLQQLQYFKDVQFLPSPGSSEGLINVDISVEEQRTGLITFGLGYGTESGINGSAQITEKNFLGTGRSIGFKGEYGQYRQLLEFSMQEPWLFNTPTFAGFSISYSHSRYENIPTDNNYDGIIDTDSNWTQIFDYQASNTVSLTDFKNDKYYERDNFSIGFNISRRLFVFGSTYLSYSFNMYQDYSDNIINALTYSTVWTTNSNLNAALTRPQIKKHTIGWGTGVNTTDNALNPTKGVKMNFDVFLNGGFLGGDINYIRPKINLNAYWTPFWKLVLAGHISSELLMPQFDGKFEKDYADLLWFDGVYEMRGFQGSVERGESKVFYSTELRFPIYEPGIGLWGLAFFDLGRLWSQYDQWTFNGDGYLFSFGLGIRINIPMIPIRLYVARRGEIDQYNRWNLRADTTGSTKLFNQDWNVVFSIQGLF